MRITSSDETSLTPPGSLPTRQMRQNFLVYEFIGAVLAAAVLAVWIEHWGQAAVLEAFMQGNRGAVYGTLASVFGALLGFVITTLAIVLSLSGHERLQLLKKTPHYRTLWKIFTNATWSLALATAIPVVALVVDREKHPMRWPVYLVLGTTLLGALRVFRCIWVLEKVVAVVTGPHET